ncbi:MAG: glycosyl hydrolase, partial [Lachnospiraceae bacterium]|nr:glycosyl hydrolase [Lachnospiraceae bacterium]
GQHTTKVLPSVGKPATSDQNGPSGFSSTFVGGGSGASYPAPCLRAATWNKELSRRVGELIGEDGLHSNCNGLYGPAANTHRNAYCGRNFEYYSEDPVLTSGIGTEECLGIQSKGIIVYEKHFALNDSETHREGVCTWANEQSIREIYLEAFRGILKKDGGNAHAVMSAFNRFGTIWSGDSDPLMNKVLRGEWGFDGFIVTDADACDTTTHCTFYMYAPRAVTTGTDLYDGVDNHTRADQLSAFSSDAYVVTAMRTAVQRALYAVANSAAMNGLGVNVVVAESSPWWQILIRVLLGVTAAMTIGSVVMWILQSKKQS